MATSYQLMKPPVGAQINWGHPLTKQLQVALYPVASNRVYNLVNGRPAVYQNNAIFINYRNNGVLFTNVNSSEWFQLDDGPILTDKAFTFSAGSSKITGSGSGAVIAMNTTGTNNQTPHLRYASATTLTVALYNNDLTITIPDISNGRYSCSSMVLPKSGIMEGWEGGILRGTLATGVTSFAMTSRIVLYGGSPVLGNGAIFTGHWSLIHDRTLSKNEIEWLNAEPYDMLYVPVARKYFVPAAPVADPRISWYVPIDLPAPPVIEVVSY